ncbi:MAG TPA: hypothetical protein VFO34_07930 [Candidatus Acidoferrales bacterium]|nr:hypothetical protein [Candidatus Acidoferrales bacterium]
MLKSALFVFAVAEGLIAGLTATAESDCRPASEAEFVSLRVENLEIAFDVD